MASRLNGRRFLDFALLVPNASPDGQNGLVSFAGERAVKTPAMPTPTARTFTVDGASATSNYFGNAAAAKKCRTFWRECHRGVPGCRNSISGGLRRSSFRLCERGDMLRQRRDPRQRVLLQPQFRHRSQRRHRQAKRLSRPVDILQQFGGSSEAPRFASRLVLCRLRAAAQKNPITAINNGFAGLD